MERASHIIGKISTSRTAGGARQASGKGSAPLLDCEQIACAAWARSVGAKIAQHTRAAKLVRGRLVVEVEDAVWQRSLFTLTRQIVSSMEKSLGPGIVAEIEFRILPLRREPGRAAASQASIPLAASDESDTIEDPGLRRLYRAARRKEIA